MEDYNEEKVRPEAEIPEGISWMGESPELSAEEFEKMAKGVNPTAVNNPTTDPVPEV
jgi:hypothetical protein